MKTIMLDTFPGDWNVLAKEHERSEPIANGRLHGIQVAENESQPLITRYALEERCSEST